LEADPKITGFSKATLEAGLNGFFRELTADNLQLLIFQDLGHKQRLDHFVASEAEFKTQRSGIARGPRLIAHITAGNIPNPTLLSILLGLLVRSAQFVKCATGTAFLPRLVAHSLYEAEPKLGACLEIAEWPGGNRSLEDALFSEADLVTATGSDETLSSVQGSLPPRLRFVGYGHRVSFGFITKESLTLTNAARVAAAAAIDVAMWNQLGCLSPHVFYLEHGGRVSADEFAEMLAKELSKSEQSEPRGAVDAEAAALIATRRSFYEVRAAHSLETRVWRSDQSTNWTVVYDADPVFQTSCLNRFIYVKGVRSLSEALHAAEAVRGQVSTVGLTSAEERTRSLALELAHWGAPRICPIGRMQFPPLLWRHDGRPSLGDLVTFTDWEQSES
jgi:hypothetical protein